MGVGRSKAGGQQHYYHGYSVHPWRYLSCVGISSTCLLSLTNHRTLPRHLVYSDLMGTENCTAYILSYVGCQEAQER